MKLFGESIIEFGIHWVSRVSLSFALFAILLVSQVSAVDTLQVQSPDPFSDRWRWTTFDRNDGLVGLVLGSFEDRDGNMWFATTQGAQRYDGYHWTTYTTENGLAHNHVQKIYQTRNGDMWFGTLGGINRFDGEAWTTYTTEDGLPTNAVHFEAMYQARDGILWAGFEVFEDLTRIGGIARFDGQRWTTVDVPIGETPRPAVRNIQQAVDGALWFLTIKHGVLRFDSSAGSGAAAWTLYKKTRLVCGMAAVGGFWQRVMGQSGSGDAISVGLRMGNGKSIRNARVWAGGSTGVFGRRLMETCGQLGGAGFGEEDFVA